MSIQVPIDDLAGVVESQMGWCYLLTVSDAGQARVLAVAPSFAPEASDRTLCFDVGGGTAANVTARPDCTLLWPPATPEAMSLIVDGTASVVGSTVRFAPTSAVKHRSAVR